MRSALFAVACVTVLFCACLAAQNGGATLPASVSGIVVKSGTTELVKKAKVTLFSMSGRGSEPLTAITDATGSFAFANLTPGEYRAMATRSGYASRAFGRGGAGMLLTIHPSEQIHNIVLRVSPSAAITGRVLDEDGEPMANVSISILRYAYVLRSRRLMPVGAAQTDDRGEYRVAELHPGSYYIEARATSNEAPKGMRYVPRYYPDVTSVDAAVALHIRAGDEGEADFHLVPAKSVSIKGLIVGADDRHHYNVMIGPRNFDFLRQGMEGTQVGPGGTFTIKDVLPGAYTISAMAFPMSSGSIRVDSDQAQRLIGRQEIEVGETDVEGIRITLIEAGKQLADVAGEIRLESANPKPLDQLRVLAQPTAAASFASPYDMGVSGGFAAVKRDGSFQLKLRGGSHFYTNVTANNRDFEDYYTKDVLYAGHDVTASGFTVGAAPGKLTIVVADDGSRIEGSVVDADNHPYASATVIAVPEDQYRDWHEIYGRAESDQNGRFTMRGLRPGDYRLFAWEEMQDGAFMDPEFMRDYDQLGVSVHAKPNGSYQLSLKLIPDSE